MYIKQKNKIAILSQCMISDALLKLMKRKSFAQITVTEICEEAGIGRKTFYRNFELREDIIDFQLDKMLEEYKKDIAALAGEERLRYHFSFVIENVDFFILLYRDGLSSMAYEKFSALLPENMPIWSEDPVEQAYRSAYIVGGIEAIERTWFERGCKETVDDLLAVVARMQEKQEPVIPH